MVTLERKEKSAIKDKVVSQDHGRVCTASAEVPCGYPHIAGGVHNVVQTTIRNSTQYKLWPTWS